MKTRCWLDEVLSRMPTLTENDAMWVLVGVALVTLYLKFPIDWNAAFGWR